jgi:hypothetical protein
LAASACASASRNRAAATASVCVIANTYSLTKHCRATAQHKSRRPSSAAWAVAIDIMM